MKKQSADKRRVVARCARRDRGILVEENLYARDHSLATSWRTIREIITRDQNCNNLDAGARLVLRHQLANNY